MEIVIIESNGRVILISVVRQLFRQQFSTLIAAHNILHCAVATVMFKMSDRGGQGH